MHEADAAQIRLSIQDLSKAVQTGFDGIRNDLNNLNREAGVQSTQIETLSTQTHEIFQRINNPETYCGLGKNVSKLLDEHRNMPHAGETPKAARPAIVVGTAAGAGGALYALLHGIEWLIGIFHSGQP